MPGGELTTFYNRQFKPDYSSTSPLPHAHRTSKSFESPMGICTSGPSQPRYTPPPRAVAAGRVVPRPGAYSQYYAQAEAAFRAGDMNGDGVLDAQELYGVLVRLGFFHGVPLKDCSAMMEEQMQRADNNVADRRITFDEFVPYFEYLMHELQRRGIHIQPPAQPTQFYGQPQYGVVVQNQYQGTPQYGAPSNAARGGNYYGQQPRAYGNTGNNAKYGAQLTAHGGGGGRQTGGRGGGGVGAGGIAAAVVGGAVVGSVLMDGGAGIGNAAAGAGGAMASGAGAIGGFAGNAASAIGSGAGAVADWAPGAMNTAGGAVGGFAGDAGNAIGSAGGAVADWAPGAMNTVGGFAGDAGNAIGSGAGAVADWAPGAMSSVGGFAGDAGGAIGGFAGQAGGAIGGFAGEAGSAMGGFAGDMGGFASGAGDFAGDAISAIGDFFG